MRCRCYTVATSDPVVDLRPTCPGWSGWRDLNPRPLAPKASALPSCATPRAPASADRSLRDHQDTSSATAHIPPRSGQQVRLGPPRHRGASGRSSMAEPQPSKLAMRVRFPSPAPPHLPGETATLPDLGRGRRFGLCHSCAITCHRGRCLGLAVLLRRWPLDVPRRVWGLCGGWR